ncbi:MAG: hypothetical protein FJ225_04855 [Lentisphaerae bacterium]|nr:hypothetical protein [Lentisphaerota bacterium]
MREDRPGNGVTAFRAALPAALAAAFVVAGCEPAGRPVAVDVRASATVEPPYRNMVVLFRFYVNGEPAHSATPAVGMAPSRADYATRLSTGDSVGVTAAVYWNNGTEYVPVTEPESRDLSYARARDLAETSGGKDELRCVWNVDLRLVIPQ